MIDPDDAIGAELRPLAEAGLSARQAAQRLGVTRNTVIGRAWRRGIHFAGAPVNGGGCNSAQARAGWATRRARKQTSEVAR